MSVLPQEIRERLHKVQGLITLEESDRLSELAAAVQPWQSIVELGSHTGRSTLWLAAGARLSGAHVVAVDPWPEPGYTAEYNLCNPDDDPFAFDTGEAVLQRFITNVNAEGAWDVITVIRGYSTDVAATWVNPLGLLFVDANHGYGAVRADLEEWLPKLSQGGVVAMHDWFEDVEHTRLSQVADAWRDVAKPDEWDEREMTENLWVAERL